MSIPEGSTITLLCADCGSRLEDGVCPAGCVQPTFTYHHPVLSETSDVRAEERAALKQHRHMERMRREADRAREKRESTEKRERRRVLRGQLDEAQRLTRRASRDYSNAITAYVKCRPDREREVGRELDRAYMICMSAGINQSRIEREIEAL